MHPFSCPALGKPVKMWFPFGFPLQSMGSSPTLHFLSAPLLCPLLEGSPSPSGQRQRRHEPHLDLQLLVFLP
ncbi:unnamed protein product, partial [Bubo scandiacus]